MLGIERKERENDGEAENIHHHDQENWNQGFLQSLNLTYRTRTVTSARSVCPSPFAVRTYVVVFIGETVTHPFGLAGGKPARGARVDSPAVLACARGVC